MKHPPVHTKNQENVRGLRSCLSCGSTENMKRRKYCSIECRQRLRRKLNQRTGLLRALNTRYATFYFTDTVIVMDVLTYAAHTIYSFIYPRSQNGTPGDDFSTMSNILGNVWWNERRRTNKKYLASGKVLDRAGYNEKPIDQVRPSAHKIPAVKGNALIYLKLSPKDIDRAECHETIKRAYRRQVMENHPDRGGSARAFIKIRNAYEDLLEWANNPTFICRKGFPDKWFYSNERNEWIQPIPDKKRH